MSSTLFTSTWSWGSVFMTISWRLPLRWRAYGPSESRGKPFIRVWPTKINYHIPFVNHFMIALFVYNSHSICIWLDNKLSGNWVGWCCVKIEWKWLCLICLLESHVTESGLFDLVYKGWWHIFDNVQWPWMLPDLSRSTSATVVKCGMSPEDSNSEAWSLFLIFITSLVLPA